MKDLVKVLAENRLITMDAIRVLECILAALKDDDGGQVVEDISKPQKWLDVAQVAKILGCSKHHVKDLCDSGALAYGKQDGKRVFDQGDLDAFVGVVGVKAGDLLDSKDVAKILAIEEKQISKKNLDGKVRIGARRVKYLRTAILDHIKNSGGRSNV